MAELIQYGYLTLCSIAFNSSVNRVKVEQVVQTRVIEWRWGLICIFLDPHILTEIRVELYSSYSEG